MSCVLAKTTAEVGPHEIENDIPADKRQLSRHWQLAATVCQWPDPAKDSEPRKYQLQQTGHPVDIALAFLDDKPLPIIAAPHVILVES